MLESKQALVNVQADASLFAVKPKTWANVQEKVSARLTPVLVSLYSQGYDPTSQESELSEGMRVLEDLRSAQTLLALLKPVVDGLHDDKVSGRIVWSSALEAKAKAPAEKAFTICGRLPEVCLQREVDKAATAKDFESVMPLLFATDQESFDTSIITDEARRTSFREREITRLAAELLREDDKIGEVKTFVSSVLSSNLLSGNSPILEELKLLKPLLHPMDCEVDEKVLQDCAQKFKGDRSLRLHKMMNNFSTGMSILAGAAHALEQRVKDKTMQLRLEDLLGKSEKLEVLGVEAPPADLMRELKEFQILASEIAQITSNASSEFKDRNGDAMEKVTGKIKD